MKKYIFILFFFSVSHLCSAQATDGIYVIPAHNIYSVILSNNGLTRTYTFSLEDAFWESQLGSWAGDGALELSGIDSNSIRGFSAILGPLGFSVHDEYCNNYNPNAIEDCELYSTRAALPVLMSNGRFKAVYRTQFGAEWVAFESNGIVVILMFEYGDTLQDRTWIGAYTASISEDLATFDLTAVVETDPSEDPIVTSIGLQIEDLDNPQAKFINFECNLNADVDMRFDSCEQIEETYFSKLIRIF